ncbi:uncharacterized protein HaLaN_16548, partial [Haematococcus lacustris]
MSLYVKCIARRMPVGAHPLAHAANESSSIMYSATLMQSMPSKAPSAVAMYLMYYENANGERVYTMAKVDPDGNPTKSAHP